MVTMLDDIPDDPPKDVGWPDDWTKEKRVRAIADVIREPRTAKWIAEEADVDEETAWAALEDLREMDPQLHRDGEDYYWDYFSS